MHVQDTFFQSGTPPPFVYLGRHQHHSRDKMNQAFPLHFYILQAIKIWMVRRPGNEASILSFFAKPQLYLSNHSVECFHMYQMRSGDKTTLKRLFMRY